MLQYSRTMSSRHIQYRRILTKCHHRHFLSRLSLHSFARSSLTTFVLISPSLSDQ